MPDVSAVREEFARTLKDLFAQIKAGVAEGKVAPEVGEALTAGVTKLALAMTAVMAAVGDTMLDGVKQRLARALGHVTPDAAAGQIARPN